MEHFVEFEDVCKYYQTGSVKIAAADHMSFYVDKGEFCIIVGPSGAGKTTLLNILGGMDSCDEGSVWLDGRNAARFTPKELTTYRRYDVGFVFQFYNLVQKLTAKENVELASEIVEHALDPLYAEALGVNIDNLLVSPPDSGEQALDLLAASAEIDIFISDLMLPGGMSGAEVVNAARKRYPHLTPLLISGQDLRPSYNPAVPAVALLRKPFTRVQLAQALGQIEG